MRWPLARITWTDSNGPHGWTSWEHALKIVDMSIESVGWIIQETDDRITIAAHIAMVDPETPSMDGVLTIPLCAVTKRTILEQVA